jgi:hypothetical protein
MHSCAPSAYTLAYSTVLMIVHLDSTSILSPYTTSKLIGVDLAVVKRLAYELEDKSLCFLRYSNNNNRF